tara:strand:+ start:81 stop:776 length:696 start_codon:yes stop_codon:yes gene_type:complete
MTGKAVDYSTTEVSFYRFVCNDPEVKSTYVGHTTNFTSRKSHHKHACNNENAKYYNYKIYQVIRANGNWDNWRMIEIESRLVKDKREAERIEQEFMEQLQTDMNMIKSYCTENPKDYDAKYYQEHKEEILIQNKEYREEHKAEINIQRKAYREEHKEENAIKQKEWREEHKEYRSIQQKSYREENKEKLAIQKKAYREENKEKVAIQQREKYQRRKERNLMSQEDKLAINI